MASNSRRTSPSWLKPELTRLASLSLFLFCALLDRFSRVPYSTRRKT